MTEEIKKLKRELEEKNQIIRNLCKKSGRTFEQFTPFTRFFSKEERENFVFVGQPIDGIIFCKDKIILCEIKTLNSCRTPNQERVKELVEKGKVEFREVRY